MDDKRLIEFQEVAISVVLGTILLIVLNFQLIVGFLLQDSSNVVAFVDLQLSDKVSNVLLTLNNYSLTSMLVTAFLWGLFGMIVYSALHAFFEKTKIITEDIKISTKYIHPKNFNQLVFWTNVLWFFIFPIFVSGIFILWLYFSFIFLIPFSTVSLLLGLYSNSAGYEKILYTILALGLSWFMVLGLLVFAKITKTLPKLLKL